VNAMAVKSACALFIMRDRSFISPETWAGDQSE
jgi:hypothetical protein